MQRIHCAAPGARPGHPTGHNSTQVTAAIAEGKRPDPSRTRKLSPPAPMVLHPPGCGRVGHRRNTTFTKCLLLTAWVAFRPGSQVGNMIDTDVVRSVASVVLSRALGEVSST
jgi:hypothetical protein